MSRKKKLNKIILECFTEVYQNTFPAVDLQWIIDSGEGKKEGWFREYTIPKETFESILDKYIYLYKISGDDLSAFRMNMYLGPSPDFT